MAQLTIRLGGVDMRLRPARSAFTWCERRLHGRADGPTSNRRRFAMNEDHTCKPI